MIRLPRKPFRCFVLLLTALALLLSACVRDDQSAALDTIPSLPEPETAQRRQILGDTTAPLSEEVTLFLPTEDGLEFNTVTRTIHVDAGEDLLEKTLMELLDSTSENTLLSASGAQISEVEFGGGIATVRLTVDVAVNRTDQDYLLICTAIANTLFGIEGVEAVNILAGDRSAYLCNLPTGVFTSRNNNTAAAFAQIQAESERFGEEGNASISRNALIYFPAQGGQYLLPEVRELVFTSDNYAQVLLNALMAGSQTRQCCFSPIPNDANLLLSPPAVVVSDTGERVLHLDFSSMLPSYLALAGVESWQCYGAIVLTMCSFIPELDAVRISVDGESVDRCIINGWEVDFPNALMRREDFSSRIGSSAQLYFAQQDNSLVRLECATAQKAPQSAGGLLEELISAGNGYLPGLKSIFPEGIVAEDILGTALEGRTVIVNLSANFYARCQSLNASQERLLIYGMINTLTELNRFGAVRFLVEGRQVENLSQNIYLKTALLPDPGLVHAYLSPQESVEN